MNRIIKDGLTDVDIRILKALNSVNGKAVGEEYLSIIGNMTKAEYKELIEPYLCRQGLIARGKSGRIITEVGKQFLYGVE
jgi:Holliday junction resolvasome RuvABC ATP-dependent DNA helicase subunit